MAGSTTTRAARGKSGLFLNNRHYDPTIGVFVSVDPLVTMTGEPYIYGSANPITYSDPTGLCGHCMIPDQSVFDDFGPNGTYFPPDGALGSTPDNSLEGCGQTCEDELFRDDRSQVCDPNSATCTPNQSGFGRHQAWYCATNWECLRIDDLSKKAVATADRWKRLLKWSPAQKNAFRHAYWNALIALEFGEGSASAFASAHEKDNPPLTPRNLRDQFADEWNNQLGADLGQAARDSGVESGDIELLLVAMTHCSCAGSGPLAPGAVLPGFGGSSLTPLALDTAARQ